MSTKSEAVRMKSHRSFKMIGFYTESFKGERKMLNKQLSFYKYLLSPFISPNIIGGVLNFIIDYPDRKEYKIVKKSNENQALLGDVILPNKIIYKENGKLVKIEMKTQNKMPIIPLCILRYKKNILDYYCFINFKYELEPEEVKKLIRNFAYNDRYILNVIFEGLYSINWLIEEKKENKQNEDENKVITVNSDTVYSSYFAQITNLDSTFQIKEIRYQNIGILFVQYHGKRDKHYWFKDENRGCLRYIKQHIINVRKTQKTKKLVK